MELMTIEGIARVCHETNRIYCQSINDNSQLPWNEAPDWQRISAVKVVRFHLDNPDAGCSASHESWLKEKYDNGWKYGPVKDPDKKEHPCCVPYEQLPEEQQIKDHLFKSVCKALLPFVKYPD